MIRSFRLSDLNKIYENETPEQREKRYAENRERLARFIQSWEEFRAKHPEIADKMVCAA